MNIYSEHIFVARQDWYIGCTKLITHDFGIPKTSDIFNASAVLKSIGPIRNTKYFSCVINLVKPILVQLIGLILLRVYAGHISSVIQQSLFWNYLNNFEEKSQKRKKIIFQWNIFLNFKVKRVSKVCSVKLFKFFAIFINCNSDLSPMFEKKKQNFLQNCSHHY